MKKKPISQRFRDAVKALGPLGKNFKDIINEVEHLERASDMRQRRIEALNYINNLTPKIARIESTQDVTEVLKGILEAALTLTGASRGIIVLLDDTVEDGWRIYTAQDFESGEEDMRLSRSLISQILARGEGIVTTNIQQDERFEAGKSLLASNIRSVMATPIKVQEGTIGGLYIDSELSDNIFQQEDLDILSAFADQAAVTLSLATSLKAQRDLHMQSILALVHAVEAADAYTAGHSRRVGYYAQGIAQVLGMNDKEVELLMIAGYLHDIGKIAMTANVSKASTLTELEWEEMRKHTIYGEGILRNSPALAEILPAVRSHHERWDGSGYPDKIKGDNIHPYARIIAVADSFDAMTTTRPYREAYDVSHALTEIEEGIGHAYEERVARAFLSAFSRGIIRHNRPTDADEAIISLMNDETPQQT